MCLVLWFNSVCLGICDRILCWSCDLVWRVRIVVSYCVLVLCFFFLSVALYVLVLCVSCVCSDCVVVL